MRSAGGLVALLSAGLLCPQAGCLISRGGSPSDNGAQDGSADQGEGDLEGASDSGGGQPGDLRGPGTDLRGPGADLRAGGPPCMKGTGFAAFRFHYAPGTGTNAIVDAFGLPDHGGWKAVPAHDTMVVDALHGGGLEIADGNWILILFSIAGLSRIDAATLSIRGRSYNTTASGSFEGWSPIHGGAVAPLNSVSNAWPYTWTSVDYTGKVQIGDDPGLTGMRLYPRGNSSDLVINTVELCIDGA